MLTFIRLPLMNLSLLQRLNVISASSLPSSNFVLGHCNAVRRFQVTVILNANRKLRLAGRWFVIFELGKHNVTGRFCSNYLNLICIDCKNDA